jgi:hypothetical protein
MVSSSIVFRSVVFSAALAAFAAGQAFASPSQAPQTTPFVSASPILPLPPFPPGHGHLTASASPILPLPPFPPGHGHMIASASPILPLPPFPPGHGHVASQA